MKAKYLEAIEDFREMTEGEPFVVFDTTTGSSFEARFRTRYENGKIIFIQNAGGNPAELFDYSFDLTSPYTFKEGELQLKIPSIPARQSCTSSDGILVIRLKSESSYYLKCEKLAA